ncbi:DUF6248 family natural product biosynthesis protein [Streptomyces sp. NPDC093509]|uniref:DUF6248 family natural product biosynthesis protein n=1 Tax=Streptomyces sp. NPDC093509 TaxID=3154982 RepID=UPI00344EA10D
MTTYLRHIGAAILGILDPIPSPTASPMSEKEGTWVRAHGWTKGLRRIDDAYPHGFHRWCSCESGICNPCMTDRHDACVSAAGPRIDRHAGTITDSKGFVVALIRWAPGQRPCRWTCPCTHPVREEHTAPDEVTAPQPVPEAAEQAQLSLFDARDRDREDDLPGGRATS